MATAGADEERSKCSSCRGTGKVISGLGGTPREVTCPWCDGTGSFQSGRDAQAAAAGAAAQ
jgi:DnaJ-class molecular chaperone